MVTELNDGDKAAATNDNDHCRFVSSTDVGSFLCCYIYLKSLQRNDERTLFVHVPNESDVYSADAVSQDILRIIEKCVQQLAANNKI